jgi:hypothetical protein
MQNGEGRLIGPNVGASMKRIIVLLVFSAFIAVPATAVAKQKSKQQTEADEIAKQHDNTLRALRDGLPLILPSWSLPVYFGMHMDEKDKKPEKTATKKK